MPAERKRNLLILALLSTAYFVLFIFPNAAASEDIKMVLVFEPDEAVPLPYVFDMIKPADTLRQTLINFAFYDYYFYGYPHFAFSALVLLPLKWAGQLENIPLVMAVLRQMVSVLPALVAICVLIYAQTGFRSYKSIVLFALLASIPAVVQNNFWWHPDSLAILLMMLAILFLAQDNLRFGRYFYFSAAMCGFAAMTKGIGFYFFLAVGVYLAAGLISRKAAPGKIILSAAGYLFVMGAAYFAANPILFYSGVRRRFFEVMQTQSVFLTQGYDVLYAVGPGASWPVFKTYYGGWPLLLASTAACVWGIWRGPNRLLQAIILAWVIPLTVLDFGVIHFKFQYWLPAALPLFSTLAVILPEPQALKELIRHKKKPGPALSVKLLISSVMILFVLIYAQSDIHRFDARLNRGKNNPAVSFHALASNALAPLPEANYFVYHDVRMYVPESAGWTTESRFEVLTYPYIKDRNFDILLLMQSRINDYLNPGVTAVEAGELALAQQFYRDARNESIRGYRMIFRNDFGLVFVENALYQEHFK